MKKMVSLLILALVMSLTLGAVADSDYPSRSIKVLVPGSAGGAADIGVRAIQSFLEAELGQPIVVENISGGGGWPCQASLTGSKPDGYTIGVFSIPALPAGYLDAKSDKGITREDWRLLALNVSDMGVVAIRSNDERFTDLASLVAYAQDNEVTGTTAGFSGDDHIALLKCNQTLGTKITPVHCKSTPEGLAAFLGGHIDVFFANVSDVLAQSGNEDMKVIGIMSETRAHQLPDIPTFEEAGVAKVLSGSSRGFAAPADLPDDIAQKLETVFGNVMSDPEYVAKMDALGMQVTYLDMDDFNAFLDEQEAAIMGLSALLGWEE